jgi:cellulose synthase/poly-beta-1,6-N-acetylglucosamine synthase-like glycosyltransferase
VRLHRRCRELGRPCRITFVPDPVAWTECPESLRVLGRQRERWHRGLAEVLWRHRRMLGNPRYGRIGLVAMPYFVFLELLGPIVELLGYGVFVAAVVTGRLDHRWAVAFLLLAFALGLALSLAAISLEELTFRRYPKLRHLFALMGVAVAEAVGYHQLSAWWRFRGLLAALRRKHGWGEMTRKGFATAAPR